MTGSEAEFSDADRDSLHILPLAILPLKTPSLKRARLIKNHRLESVIELFTDAETGSGQLEIENLIQEFSWDPSEPPDDLILLRKLSKLHSYDVYSLRVTLREEGIEVDSDEHLKLSASKNKELTEYMTEFTRPLILQIYGDDDMEINSFEDVIRLFRNPDVKKALEKIQIMSQKLEIEPEDIPKFMEDYGDIFLSLSYYHQCLDTIEPAISEFLEALIDLRDSYQFKTDPGLVETAKMMEATINELMAAITGRFENFERGTKNMWDDISATRFRKVERLISGYHTTIGGVLCSLNVKMDAWMRLFPNKNTGGPGRRAEFIMSDMKQGMDKIQKIEDSAPMLAALE